MDEENLPEPDDVVRPGDTLAIDRYAIEAICNGARQMTLALLAVGAVGLLLWLWYVWQTMRALTDTDAGDGFSTGVFVGSDGSPTIGDYITALGNTWTTLAVAVLIGGLGILLRVVAAHVARAAGVPVGALRLGDRLPGSDDDDDVDD